jgi:hypothetical protein
MSHPVDLRPHAVERIGPAWARWSTPRLTDLAQAGPICSASPGRRLAGDRRAQPSSALRQIRLPEHPVVHCVPSSAASASRYVMARFRWSIDPQPRGPVCGAGGTRPGGLGRSGRRADRARAAVGWVCGAGGAVSAPGRRGRRCRLARPGHGGAVFASTPGRSTGRRWPAFRRQMGSGATMHSPRGCSDPVRGGLSRRSACSGRADPFGRRDVSSAIHSGWESTRFGS